ncbi:reductive dehalogenase [Chloroflexota bacterium]
MKNSSAKGTSKYVLEPIERFDQKNDMFKRVRWDTQFQDIKDRFYSVHYPRDKDGYGHRELAFRDAGWYIELAFAQGIMTHDSGMYSWKTKLERSPIPPGLKLEVTDPLKITRNIKKLAKFFGASQAGICELDRRWIYSHSFNARTFEHKELEVPEECQYAIVLTFEMDYQLTQTSPAWLAQGTAGKAYSTMPFTSSMLAQFIRSLGYQAIPSGNDTGITIPMAIDAGLGELGRNGMLITREFGPRVRIAKVLTDLPLVPDEPIEFGVTEFCSICKKCAKTCPSQAIIHSGRTTEIHNVSNAGGELKWPVDAEKCFSFWARNEGSCMNCIRSCPFNKVRGWFHEGARLLVKNAPWFNTLLLTMDDWLGYGRQANAKEYWTK